MIKIKTYMYVLFILIAIIVAIFFLFPMQTKFGKAPSGKRLELMKKKNNFKDGVFDNLIHTPALAEDASYFTVLQSFFTKKARTAPSKLLKTIKTNIKELPLEQNILVWFGHSSYYMQVEGKRILVDPVFSGNVSPLPNSIKAFAGTNGYDVEELPPIDYLIITHDHWDHLDYQTIMKLKDSVGQVVTGLGVGSHFEYWGYDMNKVSELYWYEHIELDSIRLTSAPARHFSGRSLKRNNTLWSSFILKTPTLSIYLGGDSGYGPHFEEIGKQFGPFDLSILDNGQYNDAWKYIHMHPEEVVRAGTDLHSRRIFPVHSSKFKLSDHAWDEPLNKVQEIADRENKIIITPMIGEVVYLDSLDQKFEKWWAD